MTSTDSNASQTPSQPVVEPAPAPAVVAPVAAAPVETPTAPAAAPVTAAPATATPPPAPVVAAPVIPDTYQITPPKDFQLDAAVVSTLSPAFKKAGLTQDQVNTIASAFFETQVKAPERILARDLAVTMKDPELGQMNWGKTQGFVNEALAAFTTPEFRAQLQRWGVANNVEFVRVFASIGKAMRGDSPVRGQPATASEESRADRIYGRKPQVQ